MRPAKEHDHAMDEMRYFAMDLMGERAGVRCDQRETAGMIVFRF